MFFCFYAIFCPYIMAIFQKTEKKMRRERDSNPRYASAYTRFPSVLLKPLGHLSDLKECEDKKNLETLKFILFQQTKNK